MYLGNVLSLALLLSARISAMYKVQHNSYIILNINLLHLQVNRHEVHYWSALHYNNEQVPAAAGCLSSLLKITRYCYTINKLFKYKLVLGISIRKEVLRNSHVADNLMLFYSLKGASNIVRFASHLQGQELVHLLLLFILTLLSFHVNLLILYATFSSIMVQLVSK